jgi:hypothetical protein
MNPFSEKVLKCIKQKLGQWSIRGHKLICCLHLLLNTELQINKAVIFYHPSGPMDTYVYPTLRTAGPQKYSVIKKDGLNFIRLYVRN